MGQGHVDEISYLHVGDEVLEGLNPCVRAETKLALCELKDMLVVIALIIVKIDGLE